MARGELNSNCPTSVLSDTVSHECYARLAKEAVKKSCQGRAGLLMLDALGATEIRVKRGRENASRNP